MCIPLIWLTFFSPPIFQGPAALKEVNAEVVALAAAVGGYQKCFDAGKLPGGDDCLDAAASYAECDPEKLVLIVELQRSARKDVRKKL